MKKQDILNILNSCKEELQKMSQEDFVQKKVDQKLIDKTYESNLYISEYIDPCLFNETFKFEETISLEFIHDKYLNTKIKGTICNKTVKHEDIEKSQMHLAA